jgi:hypothetical protein
MDFGLDDDDDDGGMGGCCFGDGDGGDNREILCLSTPLEDDFMALLDGSGDVRLADVIQFLVRYAPSDNLLEGGFASVYHSYMKTAYQLRTDYGPPNPTDEDRNILEEAELDYVVLVLYKKNRDNVQAHKYYIEDTEAFESIVESIFKMAKTEGKKVLDKLNAGRALSAKLAREAAEREAAEADRLAKEAKAVQEKAEAAKFKRERRKDKGKTIEMGDKAGDKMDKDNAGGGDFVGVAGGGSGGGAACARVEAAASSSRTKSEVSSVKPKRDAEADGDDTAHKDSMEQISNKNTANLLSSCTDGHFTRGDPGGFHGPTGGSPGKASEMGDKMDEDNGSGRAFVSPYAAAGERAVG